MNRSVGLIIPVLMMSEPLWAFDTTFDRYDLVKIISLSLIGAYLIVVLLKQVGVKKFFSMVAVYGLFILVGIYAYTYINNPEGGSLKNVYQELNPEAGIVQGSNNPTTVVLKDEAEKIKKENVQILRGNESLSFRKSLDGHFYLTIDVNGKPIRFLLDTGATRVVLSPSDAKKLGIMPRESDYKYQTRTANGMTYNAFITLSTMKLGPLTVYQVPAAVSKVGEMPSILGMSFLDKIPSWTMKGDYLHIRVY